MTNYDRKQEPHSNKHGSLTRILSFCLAVLLIAGGVLPITAEEESDGSCLIDFSSDDLDLACADQSSIVAGLLGEGLLVAEENYINAHSKYTVRYSPVPTTCYRAWTYLGGICAIAQPYSYTANNGALLEWIPVLASRESEVVAFVWSDKDQAYRAELSGRTGSSVEFTYAASITLPGGTAINMINETYTAALDMADIWDKYNSDYSEWSTLDAKYQTYLGELEIYEAASVAHDVYETEMAEYEVALEEYESWWANYNEQKAAYDSYIEECSKYEQREEEISEYDRRLDAYNAYMDLVDITPALKADYEKKNLIARGHLAVINSLYENISRGNHSFYGVISSSLVDMVIANKNELITIGGNEEDINNAQRAAYYLEQILNDYNNCATDGGKYACFVNSLDDLSQYLELLYVSLKNLASVKNIMTRIEKEGLKDDFIEFMAMLYYADSIVSNKKTFDISAFIYGKPLSDILISNKLKNDDNKLVPLDSGWPEPPSTADNTDPVEHPGIRPSRLEKPAKVIAPDRDLAPDEPIEPDFVAEAGDPPNYVTDPGDPPKRPDLDDVQLALLASYDAGNILPKDVILQGSGAVTQILDRQTVNAVSSKISVSVYDGDREIAQIYVPFGSSASGLLEPVADRTVNGQVYTFAGWSLTPNGKPIDVDYITSLTDTMSLYVIFLKRDINENEGTGIGETTEDVTEILDEAESRPDPVDESSQESYPSEDKTDLEDDTNLKAPSVTIGEHEVSGVSFAVRLLGKLGLVPLLIIVGAVTGLVISGVVILTVKIYDARKKSQKNKFYK